jgi:hypothetical protein
MGIFFQGSEGDRDECITRTQSSSATSSEERRGPLAEDGEAIEMQRSGIED